MTRHSFLDFALRLAAFLLMGATFAQAFLELEQIGRKSGTWIWHLSPKWTLTLALFLAILVLNLVVLGLALWRPGDLAVFKKHLVTLRERFSWLRWLFALTVFLLPLRLLAGTTWGLMLVSPGMRFLILFWMVTGLGFLLTRGVKIMDWRSVLAALILAGTGSAIARELANVSDYPFALYWSEGNRFWDYSIMFGRDRYLYPADQPIFAYIEKPRQFLWGLAFLLPGLSLSGMRLWNALVYLIPYLLLGWAAFRPVARGWTWMFAGLWAYLFLSQGPIYTQLIFVALLVALTWHQRWWISLPTFILATYLAVI